MAKKRTVNTNTYHLVNGNDPKKTLCDKLIDDGTHRPRVLLTSTLTRAGGRVCRRCTTIKTGEGGTDMAKKTTSSKKVPVEKTSGGKIHLLVKENPKRAGSASHERFALYREGMTVEEFLKAGGTRADLQWDQKHGYVEVKAT